MKIKQSYNSLNEKYNKEKENNLSLNKLLEKKENDLKILNERNKRLFKEKNYLIEQLIKLTYENKLLKLKNEKKKNNLNKNIKIKKLVKLPNNQIGYEE